jgi:hypothetical protein
MTELAILAPQPPAEDTHVMTVAMGKSAAAPERERKLHLGHFAFMRAVVQGIDTRQSWNRYLQVDGDHDDIRTVRRTIAWIRDAFAAAAKRHHRPGTARLVLIDASRILDAPAAVPTLEDFAEENGLTDFTQAEQLEQYTERYGTATQQQARRGRLVMKQLDALYWLESLIATPPLSGDALAAWLHPDLVDHLEAAGLFTIRQLITHINGIGKRWSDSIQAIGAGKGERIMAWLRAHQETIGLAIGAHVAVARKKLYAEELARVVPYATAIVPLEKLIVPAELDGSDGTYRAPQKTITMRCWRGSGHAEACATISAPPSKENAASIRRRRNWNSPGCSTCRTRSALI